MPINQWSDEIVIAEMSDEPAFSDDINGLLRRLRDEAGDQRPCVIVDLKNVTFLNSSNVAQLIRLQKALTEHGRRLRICSARDPVWSMLLVMGLDKVFDFTDDVSTSLASLQIQSDG